MARDDNMTYFRNEIGKQINSPYQINVELGVDLFREMKILYPESRAYQVGVTMYICITEKARRSLLRRYARIYKNQKKKLQETERILCKIRGTEETEETVGL